MPRGRGHSTSPRDARLLIDAIPALAWWSHADGTLQFVNRRWRDYAASQPKRHSARSGKPQFTTTTSLAYSSGTKAPSACDCGTATECFDGFSVSGPRFDKNHAVRGWYVIGIEIEDRKRKESLRIAERRTLRMIADDASLVPILKYLCAAINELTRGRSLVFVMDRSGDWFVPCAGLTSRRRRPLRWRSGRSPWQRNLSCETNRGQALLLFATT